MILNRAHALLELARLERVYKRPAHAPDEPQAFAGDYVAICGTLSAEQFTGAIDAYLRSTGRFFPRPGELLALGRDVARQPGQATDLAARYLRWEQEGYTLIAGGPFTPCPVCAAVVEFTPRVAVRHDHQVHYERGIAYVGPRTGPADKDGRMLPASGTSTERTA